MNWIARYVAQIKAYLPEEGSEDVAEELDSLLQETLADQEEELGRKLNEAETFALIKEFGHPLKVASAYRPTGALISESLFPLYLLVIRYMAIILLALFAVSLVSFYIFGLRDAWPDFGLAELFNMGMFYFGLITLGFHLADRYLLKKDFLGNWNPGSLPSADAKRVSIFTSALVVVIILAWFRLLSLIPIEHSLDQLLGRLNNPLATFVLWLKIQAILSLFTYLWLLFQPYWSLGNRLLNIVSDLPVIVGVAICLTMDRAKWDTILNSLSADIQTSFSFENYIAWTLIVWAVIVGGDMLYQLIKLRREHNQRVLNGNPAFD